MIEGKTTSGFEFKIAYETLDNWDLFEALTEMDKGNVIVIADVAHMLLGEDQLKRLKNHVKGICGRVSTESMIQEIEEILRSSETGKN